MIIKNYWRKYIAAISTVAMLSTSIFGGVVYAAAFSPATSKTESEREIRNKELSMEAATEGMVLLQNSQNALPIPEKSTIALFGGGAYATVKGGGGSGEVNERAHDNIWEGLEKKYTIASKDWLENFKAGYEEGAKTQSSNEYVEVEAGFLSTTIMAKDIALTENDIKDAKADYGVYVISRYSTEGKDWPVDTAGYYDISDIDRNCSEPWLKNYICIS